MFHFKANTDLTVKRPERAARRVSKGAETSVEKATNNVEESYLDAAKLAYVKNWVHTVNKVQAIEGKWADTINKVTFYD
jgi:hypothetical protein